MNKLESEIWVVVFDQKGQGEERMIGNWMI